MASNYNHHPLPAPPQQGQYYTESYDAPTPPQHRYQKPHQKPQQQHQHQHQQQQQRQQALPQQSQPSEPPRPGRKSRAFSFRSDKSQKSTNSYPHNQKLDLHETHAEKDANRLHGHTDPTLALTESEPSMAAQVRGGINPASLRSFQHKDVHGNPITDPDRSNPTRSRAERPLDTIRGFEAAIDGAYSRKSIYKSDSESVANFSRRGSYYGNNNGPRFPQDSYYAGRPNSVFRPESTLIEPRQSALMNGPREGHYDGFEGGPYAPNNAGGRNNRYSRMQTEPYVNGRGGADRNVYPMPNNHRSYETVASGSGSGSLGEPAGYQTDPTSDNSSIDRRSPPKRQEPVNDYGISFGQSVQPPSLGLGNAAAGTPPVPRKGTGSILRKPSKVVESNDYSQERPKVEKRKSWFKRFSKS